MPQFDPAYLAGLFDGEGCVSINVAPKGTYVIVKLGLVHDEIPRALKAQFGGCISLQNGRGNRRTLYAWRVKGPRAAHFLSTILPWVQVKRRAVQLGLDHLVLVSQPRAISIVGRRLRPEIARSRQRIIDDLRLENRRGVA